MRTRCPLHASLLVAVAVLWPASAGAEVRLETRGAQGLVAEMTQGALGPWSPVGDVDAFTLNPLGDLRGDGSPSFVEGPTALRAGWVNAGRDELLLASGDRNGWRSIERLPAESPLGSPTLLVGSEASLALWQSRDAEGQLWLNASYFDVADDADQGVSVTVAHGRLLAAWSGARDQLVLVAEPDGTGELQAVVFALPSKPIIPIGISRIELDVELGLEGESQGLVAGLGSVAGQDEDEPDFLFWSLGDGRLSFVELDPVGEPLLPVEVIHRGEGRANLQALLNEAGRILRKRQR